MKDFRELKVWNKSHELTLEVYRSTRSFPKQETYGLTSQMRRAAVSVSANIAEGCARGSDKELARSCQIAIGSASELEYLLQLATDLKLLNVSESTPLTNRIVEVKKMLAGLIKKLTAEC